jgi:hypothetical protein
MKVRFPDVAIARPHYESVYCTLVHPTEPEALWVRTTVQKRPGNATDPRAPSLPDPRADVSLAATVGWEYSDPAGHRHEVVNSSVADISLAIDRGRSRDAVHPTRRGVLEIGGDRRAFDVPLQAYRD